MTASRPRRAGPTFTATLRREAGLGAAVAFFVGLVLGNVAFFTSGAPPSPVLPLVVWTLDTVAVWGAYLLVTGAVLLAQPRSVRVAPRGLVLRSWTGRERLVPWDGLAGVTVRGLRLPWRVLTLHTAGGRVRLLSVGHGLGAWELLERQVTAHAPRVDREGRAVDAEGPAPGAL